MEPGIKLYRDKITTSEFTVERRKITVQISFLVLPFTILYIIGRCRRFVVSCWCCPVCYCWGSLLYLPKIQAVKLYYHLFMQTLIGLESARANIFAAATKPYLFTLKYRQKLDIPRSYLIYNLILKMYRPMIRWHIQTHTTIKINILKYLKW